MTGDECLIVTAIRLIKQFEPEMTLEGSGHRNTSKLFCETVPCIGFGPVFRRSVQISVYNSRLHLVSEHHCLFTERAILHARAGWLCAAGRLCRRFATDVIVTDCTAEDETNKRHLTLSDTFCVTHYIILDVILYAFYKTTGGKLTFLLIMFVQRTQNDVRGDLMRDVRVMILRVTQL